MPSGAIAGLDAIKSVKDELDSVTLTTTKHPNSLKGAKFFETSDIDLDKIEKLQQLSLKVRLSDAVKLFPANINVAALLQSSWTWKPKNQS